MPTDDRLIPIGETSLLLGWTVDTLRTYERDGKLDGKLTVLRSPGGQRRYRYSEVIALRNARMGTPAGDAA